MFHYRSDKGQYKLNLTAAEEACSTSGATLATYTQLSYAQQVSEGITQLLASVCRRDVTSAASAGRLEHVCCRLVGWGSRGVSHHLLQPQLRLWARGHRGLRHPQKPERDLGHVLLPDEGLYKLRFLLLTWLMIETDVVTALVFIQRNHLVQSLIRNNSQATGRGAVLNK